MTYVLYFLWHDLQLLYGSTYSVNKMEFPYKFPDIMVHTTPNDLFLFHVSFKFSISLIRNGYCGP